MGGLRYASLKDIRELWSGPHRKRNAVFVFIALVIGLGLLVLIYSQLSDAWRSMPGEALALMHLDPRPLLIALVLQTIGWILVVDTWRKIMDEAGRDIPFRSHLRIHAFSSLAHVVPGSVWAPLSRLALYRRRGVASLELAAALALELILIGMAGGILYLLSLPFWSEGRPSSLSLALLIIAAIVAGLAIRPASLSRILAFSWRKLGNEGPAPQAPDAPRLRYLLSREFIVLLLSGTVLYLLMLGLSPSASLARAMGVWGFGVALANLLAWLPATSLIKDGSMVAMLTPLYAAALENGAIDLAADTPLLPLAAGLALAMTLAWRLWTLLSLLFFFTLAWIMPAPEPSVHSPELESLQ